MQLQSTIERSETSGMLYVRESIGRQNNEYKSLYYSFGKTEDHREVEDEASEAGLLNELRAPLR